MYLFIETTLTFTIFSTVDALSKTFAIHLQTFSLWTFAFSTLC